MEFKDILAEKMRENNKKPNASSEVKTASSFILMHLEPEFTTSPTRFAPNEIPYPARQIQSATEAPQPPQEPTSVEPEIKLENLDSMGQISYEIFMKLGATELKKEGFTSRELKKSFRKLAKKYHPDHSKVSTDEQFQQLKMAYDNLKDAA